MEDKLEKIFAMQKTLDDYITTTRALQVPQEGIDSEWMQKKSVALLVELCEVLGEVNYKWWKNPKPIDPQAVKEELVDVLHFFVSMCLTAGMSADELFALYCKKNDENVARQQGRSQKQGYALQNDAENRAEATQKKN